MLPIKSSEKMSQKQLSKKVTPRQSIEGREHPLAWMADLMGVVKSLIAEEMLKAKQKPEEEIKVEAEETEAENSEKVKDNQEEGN
jgi:hypothetical protein